MVSNDYDDIVSNKLIDPKDYDAWLARTVVGNINSKELMKQRLWEIEESDMFKNIEFIDHNECLLEMQTFCLIFILYLTLNWQS